MIRSHRVSWVGHAVCKREMKKANKMSIGKLHGKKPCKRPMSRRENNIKKALPEIRCELHFTGSG
jgi:hypothetical protein